MRIDSVTAHAFGPLAGPSLEFGDGVTVVYGPNESAKSSWHAATYAALCGRRAPQSAEDRRFVERHKPWDRGDWLVEARLTLDDGRRIRLRQNLLNNADRKAIDVDLGHDVSAEIMHDQFPDAAIWLGLDRESFRATACVAQAQILDVLDGATDLTSFLQAAAATGGAVPVEALRLLEQFHRDRVGRPRMRNPPLAAAIQAHERATAALIQARADHLRYEEAAVLVEAGRREAAQARARVEVATWAGADSAAAALRARAGRAAELTRELTALASDTPSEAELFDDDARAGQAQAALIVWRRARATGASMSPAAASGPAGPPDAGSAGAGELEPGWTDEAGPEVGELWKLVSLLEAPESTAGEADELSGSDEPGAEVAAARAGWEAARQASARAWWVIVAAVVIALAGAALSNAAAASAGVVVLLFALAAGAAGAVLAVRGRARVARARAECDRVERAAEGQAARAAGVREAAQRARAQALARAAQLGVPADPARIRGLIEAAGRRRLDDVVASGRRDDALVQAEATVLAAAKQLGLEADAGAAAAAALEVFLQARTARAGRQQAINDLRPKVAAELGESTLPELVRLAEAAQQRAVALRTALLARHPDAADQLATAAAAYPADPAAAEEWLEGLRAGAQAADADLRAAESAWRAAIPTLAVAEAEEREVAAAAEHERLAELDDTLTRTMAFMRQAQDWAHRAIAPNLKESLGALLPVVTRGRYTEAAIDPVTLEVTVWGDGGADRRAARLSHGTAEQVYLLLRLALAEYLVADGVSCPLLFDDVTVHADRDRTTAILDVLLAASARHQVIVFTQQEQVREWAAAHLDGPRHALIELPALATV